MTRRPIRRVERANDADPDLGQWPGTLPAVRQLLTEGLELGPATVFVGENGSGKSTLVEALALTFGLSREGGSTGARHSTRESESDLHRRLALVRNPGTSRWGFFLRAETMHGFYTYLEQHPGRRDEPRFHEMSHGESFLDVIADRFRSPGLYVLDEPESALSFTGCLALVGHLHDLVATGSSQVIVATHSPIVAALPGATIIEVGEWGLRTVPWDELPLVDHWRRFLQQPQSYLRHVLAP